MRAAPEGPWSPESYPDRQRMSLRERCRAVLSGDSAAHRGRRGSGRRLVEPYPDRRYRHDQRDGRSTTSGLGIFCRSGVQPLWSRHRDALGRVIYKSDSIGCGLIVASPLIYILLFYIVMSSHAQPTPWIRSVHLLISIPFVIGALFFFHRRWALTFDLPNSRVGLSFRNFFSHFEEEFPIDSVKATVQRVEAKGLPQQWVHVHLPGWRILLGVQLVDCPSASISEELSALTGIDVSALGGRITQSFYTPKISRTKVGEP